MSVVASFHWGGRVSGRKYNILFISFQLSCCGLSGPEDWGGTHYLNSTRLFPPSCGCFMSSSVASCTISNISTPNSFVWAQVWVGIHHCMFGMRTGLFPSNSGMPSAYGRLCEYLLHCYWGHRYWTGPHPGTPSIPLMCVCVHCALPWLQIVVLVMATVLCGCVWMQKRRRSKKIIL